MGCESSIYQPTQPHIYDVSIRGKNLFFCKLLQNTLIKSYIKDYGIRRKPKAWRVTPL